MIPPSKQGAMLLSDSISSDDADTSKQDPLLSKDNLVMTSYEESKSAPDPLLSNTLHATSNISKTTLIPDIATKAHEMNNIYSSNVSLVPGGIDPKVHATVLKTQKLLLRLTKALFAYGAPLYRVELRVQAVAESLNVPLAILTLPNAMVLAFGDGSPGIWPQTYIVKGYQGQNMGRLHVVDKWAKKIMAQCIMTKQALQLTAAAHIQQKPITPSTKSSQLNLDQKNWNNQGTGSSSNTRSSSVKQKTDDNEDKDELDGEPEQGLISNIRPNPTNSTSIKYFISSKFDQYKSASSISRKEQQQYQLAPLNSEVCPTKQNLERIERPNSNPNKNIESPISPDLPGTPNMPSPIATSNKTSPNKSLDNDMGTNQKMNTLDPNQNTKLAKHVLTLSDAELDWFLKELDRLVRVGGDEVPTFIRIISSGLTAMLLLLMLYVILPIIVYSRQVGAYIENKHGSFARNPATVWDLVLTFILGTMNGALTHWGEVKKINALEVLIPMIVSMVGKVLEVGLQDQICFGTITMFACFSYFPGTLMALSMVELASRNLVSGTVRMFYSFVRSIKFGFGLAMGSRLIGWLNSHGIPGVQMPKDNIHCMDSNVRSHSIDVYKNLGLQLLVFIPMSIAINIILRSKKSQWLGMCFASVVGLFTLQLASNIFTKDASAALAAFSIGMVSHMLARYKDDLAIANILAGITWLTPGSVGVRGAALLMTDDLKGSTSFALDMIIRAMSVSIGLYVSGLILFPMVRKSKLSVLTL